MAELICQPRSIQSRSALRFREAGNRRGALVTTLGHEQRRSKHAGRKPHAPMHSGRLDGFCLVSSDSDFTRLASRLREQGADVYGFGEQKTPESFRQACRKFIYTENL